MRGLRRNIGFVEPRRKWDFQSGTVFGAPEIMECYAVRRFAAARNSGPDRALRKRRAIEQNLTRKARG
jgi:hypothetical protein